MVMMSLVIVTMVMGAVGDHHGDVSIIACCKVFYGAYFRHDDDVTGYS